MKKYINRGLMYQWFVSSKLAIFLGVIIYSFSNYRTCKNKLYDVAYTISARFDNSYHSDFNDMYILAFIIAMIHFVSQGLNKKHKEMFLLSSPFTKKQIKYNELICLGLTLNIFAFIYVAVNLILYYQHYELISIIYGFFTIMIFDVIKIYVFGILIILVLIIFDTLFSNNIISLISAFTIIPAGYISLRILTDTMLYCIKFDEKRTLAKLIFEKIESETSKSNIFVLFNPYANVDVIRMRNLAISLIIAIVLMVVLMLVHKFIMRYSSLECSTKIFTSKASQNVVTVFCSIFISSFITAMIFDSRHNERIYTYGPENAGFPLVYLLLIIIIIGIASFIVNKIVQKIINKIG